MAASRSSIERRHVDRDHLGTCRRHGERELPGAGAESRRRSSPASEPMRSSSATSRPRPRPPWRRSARRGPASRFSRPAVTSPSGTHDSLPVTTRRACHTPPGEAEWATFFRPGAVPMVEADGMRNRDTHLVLVRHGQSQAQVDGFVSGHDTCRGLSPLRAAARRRRCATGARPPGSSRRPNGSTRASSRGRWRRRRRSPPCWPGRRAGSRVQLVRDPRRGGRGPDLGRDRRTVPGGRQPRRPVRGPVPGWGVVGRVLRAGRSAPAARRP